MVNQILWIVKSLSEYVWKNAFFFIKLSFNYKDIVSTLTKKCKFAGINFIEDFTKILLLPGMTTVSIPPHDTAASLWGSGQDDSFLLYQHCESEFSKPLHCSPLK